MNVILAILSVTLGLASLLLVVVVPVGVLIANRRSVLRNEDRHVSGTPGVGSVVGFFAAVLAPIGTLSDRFFWSWVPLAAEVAVFGFCLGYWNLSGLQREVERQRQLRRR